MAQYVNHMVLGLPIIRSERRKDGINIMGMTIRLSRQASCATVTGADLSEALGQSLVSDIRQAWVGQGVLVFPDQSLSDDDLERFTGYFGDFGEDPFLQPIPGRGHIIAIQRKADETSSLFAETWHTDWSFQNNPPAGTCLYRITITESGGYEGYERLLHRTTIGSQS